MLIFMSIINKRDIYDILKNLQSSVREFRESAIILLDDIPEELRKNVYRMLFLDNEEKQCSALIAISNQQTWVLCEDVKQRIKHIASNGQNDLLKVHAVIAMKNINIDRNIIIETMKKNLHDIIHSKTDIQEQFVISNYIELAMNLDKDGVLLEYLLNLHNRGYKDEPSLCEYIKKNGYWTDSVKYFIQELLEANSCHEPSIPEFYYPEFHYDNYIVEILNHINIPCDNLIDATEKILSRTKNINIFNHLINIVHNKGLHHHFFVAINNKAKDISDYLCENSEESDCIRLGKIFASNFELLSDSFFHLLNTDYQKYQIIILFTILHSKKIPLEKEMYDRLPHFIETSLRSNSSTAKILALGLDMRIKKRFFYFEESDILDTDHSIIRVLNWITREKTKVVLYLIGLLLKDYNENESLNTLESFHFLQKMVNNIASKISTQPPT